MSDKVLTKAEFYSITGLCALIEILTGRKSLTEDVLELVADGAGQPLSPLMIDTALVKLDNAFYYRGSIQHSIRDARCGIHLILTGKEPNGGNFLIDQVLRGDRG